MKTEDLTNNLKNLKKKEPKTLKEFKEFINRGSVVDLAVGIIIGGAFTSIVNSLVNDVVMPVVSMIIGGFDFSNLKLTIPAYIPGIEPATINYGNFITAVINFLIIAFVIFLLVRTLNKMRERAARATAKAEEKKEEEKKEEQEDQTALLKEIRDLLKANNKKK
ncbi:large-conductance mechanosensitive channel protein MscL [Candidatus Saccharibacteria bacterium]|nr:large-conductance mechanosensitive channel protein MscL [Candidatus Saccharibacteria bacterium]